MSQDYQHHHHHHQGIFNFPNGFDRPQDQEQHHHHVAQQIRRDKLRVPGFEPQPPLVPMEEDVSAGGIPVYEAPGNMLSEMFNFPPTELLQNQIPQNYDRNSRQPAGVGGGSECNSSLQLQGFHNSQISPGSVSQAGGGFGQFTWVPDTSASTGHGGGGTNIPGEIGGGLVEGQGLSLSLSSSLQQLGAAKAEEYRMGDGGGGAMLFFNQGGGGAGPGAAAAASNYSYKNFVGGQKIQPLLRTNANGGKLIRLGNGVRIGYSLHGLSPKGDVEALPVSQGCDSGPVEAQLRAVGRQRRGDFWSDERRDPRLKLLEQSLRQQRAFHQMGMIEQEAWRPQRGLPERSVNILRAWLFEHFLHPYVFALHLTYCMLRRLKFP
ncbi:hypothetical protein C3L33_01165, partial [Rhododendron williamsianum]